MNGNPPPPLAWYRNSRRARRPRRAAFSTVQSTHNSPPLCKGRCRASARRRDCPAGKNVNPSVSFAASSPYTRGPLAWYRNSRRARRPRRAAFSTVQSTHNSPPFCKGRRRASARRRDCPAGKNVNPSVAARQLPFHRGAMNGVAMRAAVKSQKLRLPGNGEP